MRCLSIVTTYCKGGPEFKREGDAFKRLWGGDQLVLDRKGWGKRADRWPWNRRWTVEHFLHNAATPASDPVDCVAIFGHGTAGRLIATGHRKSQVGRLADALAACLNPDKCTVILYACATGRGKQGFADVLWLELQQRGINARVLSHYSRRGHTTFCPFVEEADNTGGTELLRRGSLYWAAWRRRLVASQRFRLTYWARTYNELIAELHMGS